MLLRFVMWALNRMGWVQIALIGHEKKMTYSIWWDSTKGDNDLYINGVLVGKQKKGKN